MAEHVQQNLERMVPELEELERLGIFSGDEIRNIIRKRRDFEYVLHRKGAKKTDYLRYMQYELNLDMLRKRRKSRLRIRGPLRGEYAGITRIHSIFQIALNRFMGDVKLWIQYIDFCKRVHCTVALGKTFARALQFHSEKPSLWIMAAKWEFEDNNNVPNCRALFQRGLRVNSSSKQLWLEYFRMELLHLEKIKKRRAVLGLKEGEKQQENDEEEEVAPEFLSGKVPEIVFKKAIECIPDDVQFRKSFIDIYRLFEDTKEGCDLIYNSLLEDFPLSEEAWNLLARRHLEESISDANKKSGVVTDVQWSELESEMNKLFQDAVKKVPTGDQCYKKIAFCILIPIIVFMLIINIAFSNDPEIFLNQGSKLTKKSSLNFATGYAKFIGKMVALRCVVSGLAKQNMSPQYLCKEIA